MRNDRENAKLMKRLRRRDPQALRQLVEEYSPLMWAVAAGRLPRFAGFTDRDVEECVSDAFAAFAQHPERFDETRGSIKTYLCSLVRNKAVDRFRASGYRPEEYFDGNALAELADLADAADLAGLGSLRDAGRGRGALGAQGDADANAGAWRGIDYQALYDAVNALPDSTREVVLRRYFMEQKPAAIALATGLPKKEVENRLYRAKRSLAKALGAKDASSPQEASDPKGASSPQEASSLHGASSPHEASGPRATVSSKEAEDE